MGDVRLRRKLGRQRQAHDHRRRASDGADRFPVPRFVAQHGHHRAHAADLGDLDLHLPLRIRLHAELHDADGAVALHRAADRRCDRRAREHRASHPHGQGPLRRRARRHRRDRAGGAGDDAVDRRGVRADRVHGRHRRQVLLSVRHYRRGRGAGVAVRQLHAGPDAVGRVARPAGRRARAAADRADTAALRAPDGPRAPHLRPVAAPGALAPQDHARDRGGELSPLRSRSPALSAPK